MDFGIQSANAAYNKEDEDREPSQSHPLFEVAGIMLLGVMSFHVEL